MVALDQTKRRIRGPVDELAVAEGCYFDPSKALEVRQFFECFLRHSKGKWAGKPFTLLPWQWEHCIEPLFGWRRADGTRRFRKGGIWIPKKNGKSTLAAGIELYLLCGDDEPGAEIFVAAADRDQASIVFNEAASMVRRSTALSERLQVIQTHKRIIYPAENSYMRALSAEAPTKEGLNISGLIFDELHAQKTRVLWDTLVYGGASRSQPLLLSISTAGYDRQSIGFEQYDYACKVRDGIIADWEFFNYIAEATVDEDWTSPAVWRKANPSLGETIYEDELAAACREALESPAKENAFRRYRLNQWTEQETRWFAMHVWDANAAPVDPAELAGRPCFVGLDLASTIDIAAAVYVFPDDEGPWQVYPEFFVPADNAVERERRDRVPYTQWIRQGVLTATPGTSIDYDRIRASIVANGERFDVRQIAIDRWNATQLATQLQGDGFEVVMFGQGFASMSSPSKMLEAFLLDRKIAHGGQPVLRWMASNVAAEVDAAGNIKPSKRRSSEKIDGIVALVMGIGIAAATPTATSIYNQPGALFL
jgi:phage terminase large subunit-like protein